MLISGIFIVSFFPIHRVEKLIGNPPETEQWLDNEAVCKRLGISTRTLQEYRNLGTLPFYKIGGKILYKQSDIQTMLERHYNPIPQTGKL